MLKNTTLAKRQPQLFVISRRVSDKSFAVAHRSVPTLAELSSISSGDEAGIIALQTAVTSVPCLMSNVAIGIRDLLTAWCKTAASWSCRHKWTTDIVTRF